jgi:hypothetical protein
MACQFEVRGLFANFNHSAPLLLLKITSARMNAQTKYKTPMWAFQRSVADRRQLSVFSAGLQPESGPCLFELFAEKLKLIPMLTLSYWCTEKKTP